jgi:hypothetical protein
MIGWFGFPQMLIMDHTLSFPRLVWTVLIFLFPFLGYPIGTVATALGITYAFYVLLSFMQTFSAYTIVDGETKRKTERALGWCFILPFYRIVVFYFRMSGFLKTLKEPAGWNVSSATLANTGDRMRFVIARTADLKKVAAVAARGAATMVRTIVILFLSFIHS